MGYFQEIGRSDPLLLTVPGIDNSGPDHWQSRWEAERDDCFRVELGMWDKPHRNTWANQLNAAIHQAGRPVILVAHSLGCHAVAWWAALERPPYGVPVVGALLVAPPEVDNFPIDDRLADFGPTPLGVLPFPSIVVASHNDPYISLPRARRLASFWGSQFADAGSAGHINAQSEVGDWSFGQFLLELLRRRTGAASAEAQAAPDHLAAQTAPITDLVI